jgi:hypothetical protein
MEDEDDEDDGERDILFTDSSLPMLPSATTVSSSALTLGAAAAAAVQRGGARRCRQEENHYERFTARDRIDEDDDDDNDEDLPPSISRTTSASAAGTFQLHALNSALKSLDLHDLFRIPQHLVTDTMYILEVNNQSKKKQKEDAEEQQLKEEIGRSPIVLSSVPVPAAQMTALTSRRIRRIASLSSGGGTTANDVASAEYDGDDDYYDSDAILRSRRSSSRDDGEETSTLPSVGHHQNHQNQNHQLSPQNPTLFMNHLAVSPHEGGDGSSPPLVVVQGRHEIGNEHPSWRRDTENVVVEGMVDARYSQSSPPPARQPQQGSGGDAVAAIIQSISEELYQVNRVVSGEEGGSAYYSNDCGSGCYVDATSSSLLAVAPIVPTDTMQAVVSGSTRTSSSAFHHRHLVTHSDSAQAIAPSIAMIMPSDTVQAVVSNSTRTSSSLHRSLPHSDTAQAVADNSTLASSFGGAIRPSDTMQAVVNGVPVASTDRTAPNDLLFPPNLTLSMMIPSSPSARVKQPLSKDPFVSSASRSNSYPYSPSLASLKQPSIELELSPGHLAAYPIDLSAAPSPPPESHRHHQHRHSFSVPEDRIRALYDDSRSPAVDAGTDEGGSVAYGGAGRPTPSSPSRSWVSASSSPYAPPRRGSEEASDALERARNGVQPSLGVAPALSAALSPTSNSSSHRGNKQDVVLVQGMQQLTASQPPPRGARSSGKSSKHSRASSSTEPDSDAAVVHSDKASAGRPPADSPPLDARYRLPHHPPHPVKTLGTDQALSVSDAAPLITPKTENKTKKKTPPPGVAVGRSLADTDGDDDEPEDYDTWLDSALATRTFDRDMNDTDENDEDGGEGEEGVEVEAIAIDKSAQSLNDWLDSVIP